MIDSMSAELNDDVVRRAALHSALGDPLRLAVVDALTLGELAPSELQAGLAVPSNLLAHHLRILERAGVVCRKRSEGDRRRTYLGLVPGALDALTTTAPRSAARVLFVCTENSARSQLAAALWNGGSDVPATSAGTRPAPAVHPGAIAAARRHHLVMHQTAPRHITDVLRPTDVVITVCDSAHEELRPEPGWVHWSVTDPARHGDDAAFDRVVVDLTRRIARIAPVLHHTRPGGPDGHHLPAS